MFHDKLETLQTQDEDEKGEQLQLVATQHYSGIDVNYPQLSATTKPPQCMKINLIYNLSAYSPPQCIRLYGEGCTAHCNAANDKISSFLW